jgi:predicted lipase
MWLSKTISKYFLTSDISSLLDFTTDRHFIMSLIHNRNTFQIRKKRLQLMCILSSVVYRYKEVPMETLCVVNSSQNIIQNVGSTSRTQESGIQEKKEEIVKYTEYTSPNAIDDFETICNSINLTNSIHNIDNILVFGIFYVNKNLIISFKGSSNFNDFISDMDISGVSLEEENIKIPGKVHKGAYDILFENDRYKFIMEKIKEYSFENIYITGHSLGGLTGTIFYAYLKEYYKNDNNIQIKLITFGCPRVGNSTFCNTLGNVTRIVNNNDIVAKLPLPINYSHPEILLHIGKIPNCNYFFNFANSIDDHHINNYYQSLLELH